MSGARITIELCTTSSERGKEDEWSGLRSSHNKTGDSTELVAWQTSIIQVPK